MIKQNLLASYEDFDDIDIDPDDLNFTEEDHQKLDPKNELLQDKRVNELSEELHSIYNSRVNLNTSGVKSNIQGKRNSMNMQFSDSSNIEINLKGINNLIKIGSVKEQLRVMIENIQKNNCAVVTVKESKDQESDIKLANNKSQKIQSQLNRLKIEEAEPWNLDSQVKVQEGVERAVAEPALIYFQSQDMLNNFNRYGQNLYYHDILMEDCDDVRLGQLCKKFRLKVGLLYGFSLEMQPITFGTYCIYGLTESFDQELTCYLMHAILQTMTRRGCKYFPAITFFTHGFQDIPMLESLCGQYKEAVMSQFPLKQVPSFNFFGDPAYLNPCQLLSGLQIPRKKQLQQCLQRVFTTISKKQFEMAQNRLFLLITDPIIQNFTLQNGYYISQYIKTIMQEAQYLCPSQSPGVIGIPQLYFKDKRQEREHTLRIIRQQIVTHCIQIYEKVAEEIDEPSAMTENILLYLTLGVIDKFVKEEQTTHREIVNTNYSQLNRNNYRLVEDMFPELRFIKLETSKNIYEYLVYQLTEGLNWQVNNRYVTDKIKHFNLEIDPQDELYFMQYRLLPIRVHRSKNEDEFYWVQGNKDNQAVWECECGFSRIYGLPCCHQLKVCGLTKRPIKSQLLISYTNQEYYDRYIEEPGKFEAKLEILNSKKNYLEPLGTQKGRHTLLNHVVNKRKFSRGSLN